MEDQTQIKENKLAIDPLNKIRISEEFDEIINQIDIDAESILLRNNQNADFKQSIIEEPNRSRKLLIDHINEIRNINLENLNKIPDPSQEPSESLFVKHCVYLDSDTIRSFTFNKDILGILLVTDFYISRLKVKKLKKMISLVSILDVVDIGENEEMLVDKCFIENLVILKELKSKLLNNQYIMNFSSKFFDEISQIKLPPKHRIKIKRLNDVFSRFSGLKALYLKDAVIEKDALEIRSLEILILNNCNITVSENYIFKGLRYLRVLELQSNKLEFLDPQAFRNLPCLARLDISRNSLIDLPDNIFSQLSNLKSLDLSRNPLKSIRKATFNGLYNLENFRLTNNNHIEEFEKNTFENLDNLKNLEIYFRENFKGIEVDPPKNLEQVVQILEFFDFTFLSWLSSAKKLKKFSLNFSSRRKIEESSFKNCYELEELALSGVNLDIDKFSINLNKLKKIKLENVTFLKDPENLLSNLEHIQDVEIIFCKFSTQSESHKLFQKFKNLAKLTFYCDDVNPLYSFPNNNKNQLNDNNKYLTDGKLSTGLVLIDHLVNNNPDMIALNLNFNGIEYLGDEFNGLGSLRYFNLSSNKLIFIEYNVFSSCLKNLVELNLERNHLMNITNEMFSNLINLEKLNLNGNLIYEIEENSFKGLFSLKYLDISSNRLGQLDKETLKDLVNVTDINLSSNYISNIDYYFDNNLKLINLNLGNNQISSVNFRLLAKLVYLEFLNLDRNQIEHVDLDEINYLKCCAINNVRINIDDHLALRNFFQLFYFS